MPWRKVGFGTVRQRRSRRKTTSCGITRGEPGPLREAVSFEIRDPLGGGINARAVSPGAIFLCRLTLRRIQEARRKRRTKESRRNSALNCRTTRGIARARIDGATRRALRDRYDSRIPLPFPRFASPYPLSVIRVLAIQLVATFLQRFLPLARELIRMQRDDALRRGGVELRLWSQFRGLIFAGEGGGRDAGIIAPWHLYGRGRWIGNSDA